MKCNSATCQATVIENRMRKCQKCSLIFCSHSCLYVHITNAHKKVTENPFLQQGEYLKKPPKLDPDLAYSNFEYVIGPTGKLIIGHGAFGELYLARNIISKVPYAIKQINKVQVINSGASLELIQREISIHIKINHPNIVKLYSYHEDKDNYYMIMEYIPNGTLFQIIQKMKGLTEKTAFQYFIQVACAIYFLHSNGLAHRDIKPENILIGNDDRVKLCDFGWCVDISQGERATFCGTVEYMSPEIINDQSYDYSTDIWSLGVLLYEMTHGYSPFSVREKVPNVTKQIFENINARNYTINKNLSPELVDLIGKMLTIDMKSRIKIGQVFEHSWVKKNEKEFNNLFWKKSPKPSDEKTVIKQEIIETKKKVDNDFSANTKTNMSNNIISNNNNNINVIKQKKEFKVISNNHQNSNKENKIPNKEDEIKEKIKQKENKPNTIIASKKTNKYEEEDLNVQESLFENEKKDEYFDEILSSIQTKNKLKKKTHNTKTENRNRSCTKTETKNLLGFPKEISKNNANELDISESEEFAFLHDLNQTRCSSKKTVDHSKMLNMNFLPKDLLYNERDYKESTQDILRTIDLVERAQKFQEERAKQRGKKIQREEEKKEGFWDKFFSTFKCGQCSSTEKQ